MPNNIGQKVRTLKCKTRISTFQLKLTQEFLDRFDWQLQAFGSGSCQTESLSLPSSCLLLVSYWQCEHFSDMKKVIERDESIIAKPDRAIPPPPPPPLPLPRLFAKKNYMDSVTKREIARFWRQKRIEEQEHLLAAIKAAARITAHNFTEEDCKLFEKSLEDEEKDSYSKHKNLAPTSNSQSNEVRVGIKDWWTKSKYAYLNQPAIGSIDAPKRRASSYVANFFNYKPNPCIPLPLVRSSACLISLQSNLLSHVMCCLQSFIMLNCCLRHIQKLIFEICHLTDIKMPVWSFLYIIYHSC